MVVFARGGIEVTPREIALMSSEQLKQIRARFFIHSLGNEGGNLAIDDHPRNANLPMDFATYEEAEAFLDWVSRQNAIRSGATN